MRALFQFLREPPLFFAAIIWCLTLAAVGGSIAIAALNLQGVWIYPVYALAVILLFYGVYLAVKLAPRMKESITQRVRRHAFTGNLLSDYGYRTQVFAAIAFFINVGYAIFHLVIAILWRSVWYGVLAGYYFLLSVLRGGVLISGRRAARRAEGDEKRLLISKWGIFRTCGILLLVLEIALAAFVTQTVLFGSPLRHSLVPAIASAAYTFYRVILSCVQVVKVRRTGDPLLQALRNINLSNAFVSLFALQITLVAAAGNGTDSDMRILNIVTGFAVCVFTIALGVFMIIRASLRLRAEKESI